ncbi:unnamed protein product [Gongylonema pulchrum]|uniref:Uncharacterized protein n=1 Tax=Gongylonema pulchrum TaxID=637853 RepID=A0A183DP37_9BILA|nr:unnamed protein product [Gongylonema pulchrum]
MQNAKPLLRHAGADLLVSPGRKSVLDVSFYVHGSERGCYCDPVVQACIIERVTSLGPATNILNYAYCAPKSFWYCPP